MSNGSERGVSYCSELPLETHFTVTVLGPLTLALEFFLTFFPDLNRKLKNVKLSVSVCDVFSVGIFFYLIVNKFGKW